MSYRREWFGIKPTADGKFLVQNLSNGRTVKSFKSFGHAIRLRDRLMEAERENVEASRQPQTETPQ